MSTSSGTNPTTAKHQLVSPEGFLRPVGGGSTYLAPKVFSTNKLSTNMFIAPQPSNLSSKGLEGLWRWGFLVGGLLRFIVKVSS